MHCTRTAHALHTHCTRTAHAPHTHRTRTVQAPHTHRIRIARVYTSTRRPHLFAGSMGCWLLPPTWQRGWITCMGWGCSAPFVLNHASPSHHTHPSSFSFALLSHGRLFLFNVMITSKWRAKLSEYALDPYLAAARDGRGAARERSLSSSHGERGGQLSPPLFISPERFGGRLPAMQSQLKPPWLEAAGRGGGGGSGTGKERLSASEAMGEIKRAGIDYLRWNKRAAEQAAVEQAAVELAAEVAAVEAEAAAAWRVRITHEVRQANQRADAWAFGCLLASLALHEKLTRQQSSKRWMPQGNETTSERVASAGELECGRRRGERRDPSASESKDCKWRRGADMDGWDYDENVSKDEPGRCTEGQLSKRKLSAVRTAEAGGVRACLADRQARRTSCVQRKFDALTKRCKQVEAEVFRANVKALIERRKQKPNGPLASGRGGPSTNAPPPLDDSFHGSGSARRDSRCAAILKGMRRTSLRPKVMSEQTSGAPEVEVWPDELLCGTGRGASSSARQSVRPSGSGEALRDGLAHGDVLAEGERLVKQAENVRGRQLGLAPITQQERHNFEQVDERNVCPDALLCGSALGATGACNRACKSSGAASGTSRDGSPSTGVKFQQDQLLCGREVAQCPPTQYQASGRRDEYLLMLRVCQGKVSPLDGVTLACCPKPLLRLATQCCTLDPEVRLHGNAYAY